MRNVASTFFILIIYGLHLFLEEKKEKKIMIKVFDKKKSV
jgi:hypothetical protein